MNRQELADKLDGVASDINLTIEYASGAQDNGIIIIYGASDDCVEIEGAFSDELGACDGCDFKLNRHGVVQCEMGSEDEEVLERFSVLQMVNDRIDRAADFEAVWNHEGSPCWTFKTEVPHSTFNIMEDGEVFCVGIIIDVKDLPE